jgi:hypothetical protein
MQHRDPAVGSRQLVGDAAGAVGAVVVHDEHAQLGRRLEDAAAVEGRLSRSL